MNSKENNKQGTKLPNKSLKEKPIKALCNSLSTLLEIIKENRKLHSNKHSKYKIKIKNEAQYKQKSRYPVNFKTGIRNTREVNKKRV